tara:strand:+ start:789 stop:911 length:123 start_codon:yes stop_codon:yes gene_type:complete
MNRFLLETSDKTFCYVWKKEKCGKVQIELIFLEVVPLAYF